MSLVMTVSGGVSRAVTNPCLTSALLARLDPEHKGAGCLKEVRKRRKGVEISSAGVLKLL